MEWAVCTEDEYTENMKEEGWVKSDCRKYLTRQQLEYLNS